MAQNPEQSILDDLAGIIDAAGEKLTTAAAEDRARMIYNLRVYFKATERQANLILASVAQQLHDAAQQHQTTPEDFLRSMQFPARIAMFAFTAGCVHQHDLDHGADPETGAQQP